MKELIEKFIKNNIDIVVLKLAVIFIFILFGTYKWFDFEVMALQPIISHSWLNILYSLFGIHGASYFLGIIETLAFITLTIGFYQPKISIIGDVIVIITGLTTLSILPQLGHIDSFIIKDILLIGSGLVLLKYDLIRVKKSKLSLE